MYLPCWGFYSKHQRHRSILYALFAIWPFLSISNHLGKPIISMKQCSFAYNDEKVPCVFSFERLPYYILLPNVSLFSEPFNPSYYIICFLLFFGFLSSVLLKRMIPLWLYRDLSWILLWCVISILINSGSAPLIFCFGNGIRNSKTYTLKTACWFFGLLRLRIKLSRQKWRGDLLFIFKYRSIRCKVA